MSVCTKCNGERDVVNCDHCDGTGIEPEEEMPNAIDCGCRDWARTDRLHGVETEHHQDCRYYNPVREARAIILDLIKGIEIWASDEDGVHDECWEGYKKALWFTMQFDKFGKAVESERKNA